MIRVKKVKVKKSMVKSVKQCIGFIIPFFEIEPKRWIRSVRKNAGPNFIRSITTGPDPDPDPDKKSIGSGSDRPKINGSDWIRILVPDKRYTTLKVSSQYAPELAVPLFSTFFVVRSFQTRETPRSMPKNTSTMVVLLVFISIYISH